MSYQIEFKNKMYLIYLFHGIIVFEFFNIYKSFYDYFMFQVVLEIQYNFHYHLHLKFKSSGNYYCSKNNISQTILQICTTLIYYCKYNITIYITLCFI